MEEAADAEVEKVIADALSGVLTAAGTAPRTALREAEGKVFTLTRV